VPGETFGGFINPRTGSFQVYSPFTPCPVVFLATTSPDGNAFNGDVYNTVPSCPGGPNTCTCVASGPSTANGRGCRVGAGGDCCGDHVVGATEECDNGPEPADACCDATCHLRASGSSCTADANPCTDDVCNATGTCTHPARRRSADGEGRHNAAPQPTARSDRRRAPPGAARLARRGVPRRDAATGRVLRRHAHRVEGPRHGLRLRHAAGRRRRGESRAPEAPRKPPGRGARRHQR